MHIGRDMRKECKLGNLRARMRRDRKFKDKLEKSKAPVLKVAKNANDGSEDGKLIAVAGAALILHREFDLGVKRICRILDKCSKQCDKQDNLGIRYAFQIYEEEVVKAVDVTKVTTPKGDDFWQNMYDYNKDDTFLRIGGIFCMALSEFGFSHNTKGTGRLDKFLKAFAILWAEYHIKHKSGKDYQQECIDEIGLKV